MCLRQVAAEVWASRRHRPHQLWKMHGARDGECGQQNVQLWDTADLCTSRWQNNVLREMQGAWYDPAFSKVLQMRAAAIFWSDRHTPCILQRMQNRRYDQSRRAEMHVWRETWKLWASGVWQIHTLCTVQGARHGEQRCAQLCVRVHPAPMPWSPGGQSHTLH